MIEFPNTRSILASCVARESYTPPGARRMAEYLESFSNEWKLGETHLVDFPKGFPFAHVRPTPCNVYIDIPPTQPGGEWMLWLNHFDSIDPTGHYPVGRDPLELTTEPGDSDLCYGLKCNDPMGGVVAMLVAAHLLQQRNERRHGVRMLLVCGEEDQSQGVHAALSQNLVDDRITCLVGTDILVGDTLQGPARLGIGRPGRVGLQVNIEGVDMHAGDYSDDKYPQLASTREAWINLALPTIQFPERPEQHYQQYMPRSRCTISQWSSGKTHGLSVAKEATVNVDVIYGNPELDEVVIKAAVRDALQRTLQDHNIREPDDVMTVVREPGRKMDFTKPYLEAPNSPLVQTCLNIMRQRLGEVVLCAAKGTADEPVVVHRKRIPGVIIAPRGRGEHTDGECVSLKSIDETAAVLADLACHDGPLTQR